MVWQAYTTPLANALVTATALIIMLLAALPAIRWAKTQSDGLPAYELMMLTFIPFYAMPLLQGHPATLGFGDDILFRSAVAIIIFQIACMLGHRAVRGRPLRSRLWTSALLDENNLNLGRWGIVLATVFVYLQTFTDSIPEEFLSILRALFFGIGIVSVFVVSQFWGQGKVAPAEKAFLVVVLFLQTVIVASQLLLITTASTILMALIGYITGRRKLPLVFMVAVFGVLAVLHNGKDKMREIYWDEDRTERLAFGDLPDFFQQWVEFGLAVDDADEREVAGGILERASLFQIMCNIAHQSPERLPYLTGRTYDALPLLVVPRLLWPDKPRPHDSNKILAVYYGFTTAESAQKVSIAFGIPSEAYANFGFLGTFLVGFGIGILFKKVGGWGQYAAPLSLAGLAQILLIAWSFQAEMTLAVWLSSLYQASVALLGIPWAYRHFTGR